MLVHASCVAIDGAGLLLRGAPGAGKSDLTLRLIDQGASLVADDQVELTPGGDGLEASSPPAIKGRMEVRGLGIITLEADQCAPAPVRLALVADLVAAGEVERFPQAEFVELLDVRLKLIRIAAFEASAPAKLRLAVKASIGDSGARS